VTRSPPVDYDVLISGAGLAGSCCALALTPTGLRVCLLEKSPPPSGQRRDPSMRVSAINRASENILRAVGAWHAIARARPAVFRRIEVWDAASTGTISFDAAEAGLSHLGYIVPNAVMVSALQETLAGHDQINMQFGDAPVAMAPAEDHVTVELASGTTLNARLVIGADGAHSAVRELASIRWDEADYHHTAIVATVTPDQAPAETARQRFLPGGPLAFLPLDDTQCSIVWSVKSAMAEQLMALGDKAFAAELAEAFEHRLGTIHAVSQRLALPLIRRHAANYIARRVALAGDAAHTVHPLAGLGANQGFADGAALAEVIGAAVARRRDPGGHSVLRRYERWRRGDNALVLQTMDFFHHLFGTDQAVIADLRGLGLNLTDQIPLLKNFFLHRATGLAGDLPRLARTAIP